MDPENLNTHFVTTAQRTLQTSALPIDNLSSTLITLLTPILLRLASTLNQLHMEMSPAIFEKLTAVYLAGHFINIINVCVQNILFPKL